MKIQNYINGQYVNPLSNQWLDNYCPANGNVYGQLPNSSKDDVEVAYIAAQTAFESWSNTSLDERSRIMLKISELIEIKLDELAETESTDNGKPIWLAKAVDIPRASLNFRFFCTCDHSICKRKSRKYWTECYKLYLTPTYRRSRMHLSMEPASLSFYLEDCSCNSRW